MDSSSLRDTKLRSAALIGVASGLGARDPRCAEGPAALHAFGLVDRLGAAGIHVASDETVAPVLDRDMGQAAAIADICRRVAIRAERAVCENTRFAVIGGDHSCAAGTWSGVADALPGRSSLGLVWVDAHMDSHTPETTPSGTYHGMPLAALMGYGDPALTGLARKAPALSPAHVALVGVRSFEWQENELLERLGVRVFPMKEVTARGLDTVMEEAAEIALAGTAGAGISIDIDVIDPKAAPGTGSPVPGGVDPARLAAAVARIGSDRRFLGCELVEYNPALDADKRTAAIATELLVSFFRGASA